MRILLIRKRDQDTILNSRESTPARGKYGAKSGFNQPCGVKAVETRQPGVLMRQVTGQGTQIALGGEDFAEAGNLAGLDRRPAHRGLGGLVAAMAGPYRSPDHRPA